LKRKGFIGLFVLTLYASLIQAQPALDTVCIFDPPNRLAVPYQAGVFYQWSVGQGVIVSPPDSNVILIDWSNATEGIHGISVVAYTESYHCPGDTASGLIRVTSPGRALAKFPDQVCEGETVLLESSIKGDFMWKGGSRDRQISFVASQDTSTYLIALNGSCDNDTISFDIQVFEQPVARISAVPDTMMFGDLLKLFFNGKAEPGTQIEWYLDRIYYNQGRNIEIEFRELGPHEILMIADNGNCSDTAVKYVYIDHEFDVFFPTAFTPNGDGLNDVWRFKGFGFEEFKAFIYNRWGERIYYWDQNSPLDGWDGRVDGQAAPGGAYVVTVEIRDQRGEMHYFKNYFKLLR